MRGTPDSLDFRDNDRGDRFVTSRFLCAGRADRVIANCSLLVCFLGFDIRPAVSFPSVDLIERLNGAIFSVGADAAYVANPDLDNIWAHANRRSDPRSTRTGCTPARSFSSENH